MSRPPRPWRSPAPRSGWAVGGPLLHETRKDVPPQCLEPFRVPEEFRHLDEDVVAQGLRLVGRLPEVADIRLEVVHVLQQHAAGDPAADAGRLVLREVDARCGAKHTQDRVEVSAFVRLG